MRKSEEEFAKLVAGVRDYAVFLLDPEGNVTTWNAGAERIKGYRAEEIIGRHFTTFYPEEVIVSGWPTHELDVAAATGRFEDEGWRLRKNGEKFWASVVITALRDDDGGVRGYLKITRDLTNRKRAEEELRSSEERFRLLVDRVKDYAIFMLDPEGRVATWNAGAARLKGYKAGEIIGKHFSCFYPQAAIDQGWPDEELRRAIIDGSIEDEGWRVRQDGSQFWASVVITALFDDSGVLQGFAKVTRDLTDRQQAEQHARQLIHEEAARKAAEAAAGQIEQQREQLLVTLSSIGDAVIVTDEHGRVTFLNPVAVCLTGWEVSDAIGRPLEEVFCIINEETLEPVDNPVVTVFRENRIVELANHTALIAKDGRVIPIEDTAAPIRDKMKSILGAVLVFRDVTEPRRASEASRYLAAIVESSDDAIIGQSLDGKIASWNRGAERLYGYRADEIIGKPLAVLVPTDHPDELPGITDRIRNGEYIDHFETHRVRKDGTLVDVSLTISPVKNAEGRVIGASKIARDITGRKEEERRKNEFLALLAHELRNPLAPLRNGLEVMHLAAGDPEVVDHARVVMERQLQHLVRLVDDLLDMSRISRGKLQLRKEQFSIALAIDHAIEVCDAIFRDQGHELSVHLPEEPIFVDADKTRIAQVISNLLTNAAKYSDPGGQISLEVTREDDSAVIRVKDTGIGIPPQLLPVVFEMFMQVDRSLEKSQGGLGVGLAIVKRLVEMHGGTVRAHSEGVGQGSEFIVRLPAIGATEHLLQPPDVPVREGAASQQRILVVDDNADAASSLAMMLELMGHVVRTANDGHAGLEIATAFQPHVVLMDIGMPRLNGYDTARQLRQRPGGDAVTLVALTGWGHEDDRRRSEAAGFDHHLVKPIEPLALEHLLASLPPQRD